MKIVRRKGRSPVVHTSRTSRASHPLSSLLEYSPERVSPPGGFIHTNTLVTPGGVRMSFARWPNKLVEDICLVTERTVVASNEITSGWCRRLYMNTT